MKFSVSSFIQVLSGSQRTSDTTNFILEIFRPTGLVYQEQNFGPHGTWKQRITLQPGSCSAGGGGHCLPPRRVKGSEDKGARSQKGTYTTGQAFGHLLCTVNNEEKPQQQTQGFQARLDVITKWDKVPSCPLHWGNIHSLLTSLPGGAFWNSLYKLAANKSTFCLCFSSIFFFKMSIKLNNKHIRWRYYQSFHLLICR